MSTNTAFKHEFDTDVALDVEDPNFEVFESGEREPVHREVFTITWPSRTRLNKEGEEVVVPETTQEYDTDRGLSIALGRYANSVADKKEDEEAHTAALAGVTVYHQVWVREKNEELSGTNALKLVAERRAGGEREQLQKKLAEVQRQLRALEKKEKSEE